MEELLNITSSEKIHSMYEVSFSHPAISKYFLYLLSLAHEMIPKRGK